ncbi:MAG: helix-turn-helix domain-containing protein, partial [Candidatus Sumerlaeota bacterium]
MTIQSVERALGLFEQLAFDDSQNKGKTLSELASDAGLARNTTHSLLKTLEGRGYAGRGEGGRYVKGPKCLEIAQVENWGSEARISVLRPVIERLAGELHEGVNFTIMVGGQRREVINVESDQAVRVDHHTASNFSPYRLVSVRALLAGT